MAKDMLKGIECGFLQARWLRAAGGAEAEYVCVGKAAPKQVRKARLSSWSARS
jgi:hypothetical protein